jgi:hypothetical protein
MSDHTGVFSTIAFDGATAPAAPNPARDYAQPVPLASVLNVTSTMLSCDSYYPDEPCSKVLPDYRANMWSGFTVFNNAHSKISVHMRGPGVVSSYPDAGLNPGDPVAFSFSKPGDYEYRIRTEAKDEYMGRLHVWDQP